MLAKLDVTTKEMPKTNKQLSKKFIEESSSISNDDKTNENPNLQQAQKDFVDQSYCLSSSGDEDDQFLTENDQERTTTRVSFHIPQTTRFVQNKGSFKGVFESEYSSKEVDEGKRKMF